MKVQTHWQGWVAAGVATLATAGLVIAESNDTGMRRWWQGHSLTTDTVSGLLVLLITLLVVNQVVRLRGIRDRSRAVAAQAAIVVGQARRANRAVTAARDGSGDRDTAADEFRTYMMMLLTGAPVLIEDRTSRAFLEQAQNLGGEMARVMLTLGKTPSTAHKGRDARLDDSVAKLRAASAPLLQQLNLDELTAAGADGDQRPAPEPGPAAEKS
jgi:hypothetical protein